MQNMPLQRRSLLKASLVGLPALAGGCAIQAAAQSEQGQAKQASDFPDDDPALTTAVSQGVVYFQGRCAQQLPLVQQLQKAIDAGDLAQAQQAYIEARPPYEEIETTALCFEDIDADIDARPYAFDGGESDPAFRGFHKIEALLFGYQDVRAAAPFAAKLIGSVRALQKQLGERHRFNASAQFDGMIGLANEVSAKKISSEEETWSDQSLLIFRHNWIGIASQFQPFVAVLKGSHHAKRVLEAIESAQRLLTGHRRQGTAALTPYSQIGMVERRRLADASNAIRDALVEARQSLGLG